MSLGPKLFVFSMETSQKWVQNLQDLLIRSLGKTARTPLIQRGRVCVPWWEESKVTWLDIGKNMHTQFPNI
jgi:hypothetical protein